MTQRIHINEAINVPGAEFIGTAKGYDLFDITTYAAAQEFVNARSNARAGSDYTQNEGVFNANVNENLHLYFYVTANTNQVRYAVIKGTNIRNQNLTINNRKNTNLDLSVNFAVENEDHNAIVPDTDHVPFFLLDDIIVDNYLDDNGLYFEDDTLVAVLPQFCRFDALEISELPARIHYIDKHAFYYGQHISSIVLSDNISNLEAGVISEDIDNVFIQDLMEAPESWDPRWNHVFEDRTHFGYGLSDEDRAQIQAEIEAREREAAEAERLERERQEREAQLLAEREARKIRYRVEGKSITIKGTRKGITELEIPEEIEGKPVTKIEAYAFYGNNDLESIKLPSSIKLIERGAFLDIPKLKSNIMVSSNVIVGKDNPYIRKRY